MSLPELLRTELERIVGADGVLTDPIQLLAYDCDAYTIEKALPTAVVLPQTTEQVAAIVRLANREGLPIVPRGAGTGLSGGALATQGGILLAFSRMHANPLGGHAQPSPAGASRRSELPTHQSRAARRDCTSRLTPRRKAHARSAAMSPRTPADRTH
jgi:hypothetical protein